MKRKIILFILIVLVILQKYSVSTTLNMEDYCYIPPFAGTSATPNVLIVADLSGSMEACAYNPNSDGKGCCSEGSGCGRTYTGREEGYFIPDKVYEFVKSQDVGSAKNKDFWRISNSNSYEPCPKIESQIDKNKKYKGSCLNFLYMRRYDLLRWALTGGTPASCDTGIDINNPNFNKCNPLAYNKNNNTVSCNDDGCLIQFGYSYNNNKKTGENYVFVPWDRITGENGGILFQLKKFQTQPRIGFIAFSGRNDPKKFIRQSKVYIGDFTGSGNFDALNPYKNTITAINAEDPDTAINAKEEKTPTGPVLWDVYNYFAQEKPQYGGFNPQQGSGDNWKNPMYQCFDEDNNGNCQGNELKLVQCAKNFVILLTDGQWNTGYDSETSCSIDDGFEDKSTDPVVPAYWLHKKGFVNKPTGKSSYVEALYVIGLWLEGTGEKSLKNVAMYGSFDRNKAWPDSLSDYPRGECSVDGCSKVGKGSLCSNLPASSPDWDKDGNGIPDTFFSASNAKKIKESIISAISDIIKKASSGATVATLTSKYESTSVVVQPAFTPEYTTNEGKTLKWIGTFRGFWLDGAQNLREDTVMDKILTLLGQDKDKVIRFVFDQNKEPKIVVVEDENSCKFGGTKEIFDTKPVLLFDCRLALTDKNDRKIYFNDSGSLKEFKTSNAQKLKSIWSSVDNTLTDSQTNCVIEYHRGEYDYTWDCSQYVKRKRQLDIRELCKNIGAQSNVPWKLGPIVYSTPTVLGNQPLNLKYILNYEDNSYLNYSLSDEYKKRRTIAVVGTNQGMLHFFRIGFLKEEKNSWQPVKIKDSPDSDSITQIEKEEFVFIPQNAIPYMLWYGKEDYCSSNKGYIPIIDYRVESFDASFDKNDNPDAEKNKDSWNTFVMGTMGLGGKQLGGYSSSVFLLKVTNFLKDNTGSILPELMWEIKLDNGALTTSYPVRVRIGDKNKNGKWYIILGSGPKEPQADGYSKFISDPKLYIINARNGSLHTVSLSSLLPNNVNAAVGDLFTIDIDDDYQDDVIYFGMYGYYSDGKSWSGLYRIVLNTGNGYKDPQSISVNDIKPVVDMNSFNTNGHMPPIFSSPAASFDENGQLWIYLNTGIFLSPNHRNIPYKNYIIGFKEPCWDSENKKFKASCSDTVKKSDLADANNVSGYKKPDGNSCSVNDLKFTKTEKTNLCDCDASGCSVKEVVKSTNANTDICNLENSKKGWFYELPNNQIAYSKPVVMFKSFISNIFEPDSDPCSHGGKSVLYALNYKTGLPPSKPPILISNNTETDKLKSYVEIGYGSTPLGESIRYIRSTVSEGTIVTQTSSGSILNIKQQTGVDSKGRFILWIEK